MSDQPTIPEPQNSDTPGRCGGRRPSSCSVEDRLSIAPNVLDRYAVDLRKYGRPLDSGLPSLLNFVAEQLRLMNPPNDQVEARRDGAPLPEKTSPPLPRTSC
jgi:hypothetical protein